MSKSVSQILSKAKRHAKNGQADLAAELYQSVLAKFPKNRRAADGLRALEQPGTSAPATKAGPSQPQIDSLLSLYKEGKLQQTLTEGEALAKQFPADPFTLNLLGAANFGLGRLDEAVAYYSSALQAKPDYVDAHHNLGNVLKELGRGEEAVASYQEALKIKPDSAETHNMLGTVLHALGRREEAMASYEKALQIKPGSAEAHSNLGNVLRDLGKPEEAAASCSKALRIRPDLADAHSNLGNALNDLGRTEEAVASYQNALKIRPDFAEAHNNLSAALIDLGNVEAAISCTHRALQLRPGYAHAYNNLGSALKALGKSDEAVASYSKSLQIYPGFAEAHRNISTLKGYCDGDPQIPQMLKLIADPNLPEADRMHLDFALGNAYDDMGDPDKAFPYFLDGNRIRKEQLGYDIAADRKLFEAIKLAFTEDAPAPATFEASEHAMAKRPIFILGMPRSGTTLVEQILASHSQVYGGEELSLLEQAIRATAWRPSQLTCEKLLTIRKRYLSGLAGLPAFEPVITDKMPLNFLWIGFILAAMPEAKIIHVKRDARAICWSNFRQFFSHRGMGFAYDLQDVVDYHSMYCDLMVFWQGKFGARIYDLQYEALTENQNEETRRLLDYADLEWEDQCLEFHKTARAVRTASAAQVRRKMYRGSSESWRKYEKHLKPMIASL